VRQHAVGTQTGDTGPPCVCDVVTGFQVQAGNVHQPRVRDLVTACQGQTGELRELGNVRQTVVRDAAAARRVQAGEPRVHRVTGRCNCCDEASSGHALPGGLA
jgi:hypothetical protein